MSLSRIASLAISLLGLFIIVKTLPAIQSLIYAIFPSTLTGVKTHDPTFYRLFLLIIVVSSIIFGLALIIFRKSLGRFMAAENKDVVTEHIGFNQLYSASFSLLGVYFLIDGCSKFLGRIIPALITESRGAQFDFDWSSGIELLLGLFLFLGASGISKLSSIL